MDESLFYCHIEETDYNRAILKKLRDYGSENPLMQIYIISAPLGEKYNYDYEEQAVIILSPKHKILFLNLGEESDDFEEYYDDVIEDLSSISDKYNYKKHIGRPRKWREDLTAAEQFDENLSVDDLFIKNSLDKKDFRKVELLISLFVGSINDIEKIGVTEPENLLDKVKRNIILFDGDQTRFIFKKFPNKVVSIQGLSGTGKTELLLHKLKELYTYEDKPKIFFTCHNRALANTLKSRIPTFFNFLKVEKQINWKSELWVDRAWGSRSDPNSGLYSYLSHFYNFPYERWHTNTNYEIIFKNAFKHINSITEEEFEYAFDYILIDERQDFPDVFFDLCEKVTRKKVYIAGDIFQDIFENAGDTKLDVDVILNKCYRTDPKTLMFAHAIGLGLFEEKKLNWFDDEYWKALGYRLERKTGQKINLSRAPIRRFEDLNIDGFESVKIKQITTIPTVIEILKNIKESYNNVTPNDIAIIILGDSKNTYEYIDELYIYIKKEIGWTVNRAIETKEKIDNTVFVSNSNNAKGLEFPFVICLTGSIKNDYRYRNMAYTMLTRSFIQSYLLVSKPDGLDILQNGLKNIIDNGTIEATEPTREEQEEIKSNIARLKQNENISYDEFLNKIFDKQKIEKRFRANFKTKIIEAGIDQFDEKQTMKFIIANKEFYCK